MDEKFNKLLSKVQKQLTEFGIHPLTIPRERKPPACFGGLAEAFHAKSVELHYRIEYFKLIDVAIQQLDDRLLECPGLHTYCQLESSLLSGHISEIAYQFPELGELRSLQTQLDMFLSLPDIARSTYLNLETCTQVMRNLSPESRAICFQM